MSDNPVTVLEGRKPGLFRAGLARLAFQRLLCQMQTIAGPNHNLGLDEPEVKACREALRPVGFAGSRCSASVKAPSESSVGDKPHGQLQ